MTRTDVQAWLERYVAAWFAYDPAAIEDLFTEDAEYRYHPWDDPVAGRAAIIDDWLNPAGDPAKRDKPGTVEASYTCYAADEGHAVAVGKTLYRKTPGGPVDRQYENVWLIDFDADGRCGSFTEYFMMPKH